MRVMHVIHNLKREGAQSVLANLVRARDPDRVDPSVHAWRALGSLQLDLRASDVTVIGPGESLFGSFPGAVLHLRRLLGRFRIDLLHAHMSDAAILTHLASYGTGIPFTITHHSNRLQPTAGQVGGAGRRMLFRASVRAAAANIAVTRAVQVRLRDDLGLPEGRSCVIPNGVDVPLEAEVTSSRARREARRAEGGGPVLVAVGRLSEVKRQASLIEAMPRILAEAPAARLRILGEGPLRGELEDLAAARGVSASVEFMGSVERVGDVLAEADVFVSASAYEGLPMALLEAMSFGLGVAASDVPGHRDVLEHDRTGLLFPVDSPTGLPEAVERLLREPALALELGTRARAHVAATYGSRAMAARYEALCENVLATPARRSGPASGLSGAASESPDA